jgi:hypothetical protein
MVASCVIVVGDPKFADIWASDPGAAERAEDWGGSSLQFGFGFDLAFAAVIARARFAC